ncbi:MAG: hypothetical protein V1800_04195 [Candidatus Latescibacterota bacterium]
MSKRTFFGRKDDEEKKEKQIALVDQDNELEKEISLLTKGNKGSVDKLISEVEGTITEATKASIRDVKLLEEGRCPSCGRKTKPFLFTTVCEYCGWSTFITPEKGHALIHMKDGNVFESKSIFQIVNGDILGITDEVVRVRIPAGNVSYIEYAWTYEEITERKTQRRREEQVMCDWCQKEVERDEYVAVTFASVGTQQTRYQYCSEKCKRSFEKQYPMRIHRNCYETSCVECHECVKKFEDEATLEKLEEKRERPEKKA